MSFKETKLFFLFLLLGIHTNAQQEDSVYTLKTVETLYSDLNNKNKVTHTPVPTFVKGINQPTISLNGDWSFEYGSNDFRSTKQNIITGRLSNEKGDIVTIESNGKQHFRAWVLPGSISFLVANYFDAGNEFYLNYDSNRTRYLDSYIAEDGDVAGWIQLKFN